MKKHSGKRRLAKFGTLLIVLTCVLSLAACGSKVKENTVLSADDVAGKTVGVQLGTTGDTFVSDLETDRSNTKVERFNKGADAVQALKQGKIDCVIIDEQPALKFAGSNSDLKVLDEEYADEEYAIAFAKGNSLRMEIDGALEELKNDGTLDKILSNYVGEEIGQHPYVSENNGSKGTLTMATNAYFPPYEYYDNGKVTGIDADIAQAFCDKLGYKLVIEDMEFDSIITAVSTGKVDFGMAGMSVTEERKQNVDFSVSYAQSKQSILVRDPEAAAAASSFSAKFKADFLDDARYNYILKGLVNTLIITVFAALIGIVIGFVTAMIRSAYAYTGKPKFLNLLATLYITIIRGTPTMVQLLIMYYVIFASVNASKILVAVLAFGLNSGAYVSEIFRSGIMSIDKGQTEAARSLGLPYGKTMRFVILPQAFKNVLPALANEAIVLLKETSISGYIGLNDMTRGGDIIRSITYDAMFPLFGVALIYLVLVVVLSGLVSKLERRLRANERK